MIEANFESRTHKNAAIAGVYQYDTGQRLRMRGLPTPDELAEMDDFLAGGRGDGAGAIRLRGGQPDGNAHCVL